MEIFLKVSLFFFFVACVLILGFLFSGFFRVDKESYKSSLKQNDSNNVVYMCLNHFMSLVLHRHDLCVLYSVIISLVMLIIYFTGSKL